MAGQFGQDVHFVAVDERNVGAARAAGFRYAKSVLAAAGTRHWYATTDADTEVSGDWLVRQLGHGADMVLGLVRVGQWRHHSEQVAELYEARYHAEAPLHQHIHGANMGFRSEAYWRVGGFAALASGEDVDLVDRFEPPITCRLGRPAVGHHLGPAAGTGAGGFADHLAEVSQEVERRADRADEAS